MAADVDRIGIEYFFQADSAIQSAKKMAATLSGFSGVKKQVEDSATSLGKFGDKASGLSGVGNQLKASTVAFGTFIGGLGLKAFSGIMGMARSLISGIMSAMPMIGEAFDGMKQVIFRNIAWPIAQFILPYLLKMSIWVKNNRALFVQMGAFIVSILRAVGATIQWLVGMAKSLFGDLMQAVFGKGGLTFSKFLDLMNLALLKIAFVVTFLEILLEPVIKGIGQMFAWVWTNAVEPFLDGIASQLPAYFGAIGEAISSIKALANGIFRVYNIIDKNGKGLVIMREAFRFLGKMSLAPLIAQFKAVSLVIDLILGTINGVRNAITNISTMGSNVFAGIKHAIDPLLQIGSNLFDAIVNGVKRAVEWIKTSPPGKLIMKLVGAEGEEKPESAITPQSVVNNTKNQPVQNVTQNVVNNYDMKNMSTDQIKAAMSASSDVNLRNQLYRELVGRGAK